jgi:hypothetical protein
LADAADAIFLSLRVVGMRSSPSVLALTPGPLRPALLGASGHLHYRPADHRPAFTRLDSSADASLEVWLFCPFSVCQPRCAVRIAVPGRSRFGVFRAIGTHASG